LAPIWPDSCQPLAAPVQIEDDIAQVSRWTIRCQESLANSEIVISGLEATTTDFLVRINYQNGDSETARLTASESSFRMSGKTGALSVAKSYGVMGVEHILGGFDHLLFVFALFLLSRKPRDLIKTITAFTIAHSISLSLSALGILQLASAPVEAMILLSVLFLAKELAAKNRDKVSPPGLTELVPWFVAFIFGLLHGLGFASALANIGLPEHAITLALLFFNLGVEVGQLLFIGSVFGLFLIIPWQRLALSQKQVNLCLAYSIGGLSAFWFLQSLASLASS
jgi:hydrogenase/urease accessory protein HupE